MRILRTSQPQAPSQYRQLPGLVFLANPAMGFHDLVRGIYPTVASNMSGVSRTALRHTRAFTFNGSQANTSTWYGTNPVQGSTEYTAVCQMYLTSAAGKPFCVWGTGNSILPFEISAGAGSGPEITSATIFNESGDFNVRVWPGGVFPGINLLNTLVLRVIAGQPYVLWINGKRYESPSAVGVAGYTIKTGSGSLTLGCSVGEGAQITGSITFASIARRGWPESLMRDMSLNPWLVFEKPRGAAVNAPTGRTGSLTATLGAATLSATGTVDIAGTATPTLGAVTSSATGTITLTGSATPTLAAVTSSSTGALAIVGTLEATLGAVTLSATGSASELTGELSATLANVSISSAGVLDLAGTASNTLGAVTSSSTGALSLVAAFSQTLAALTLSADGTISGAVIGDASITLGSLRLDAEGVDPNRRKDGAGSSQKKRRKKYLVEIDGQDFEVSSPQEAITLLARAKTVVTQAIEKAQATQIRPGIPRPVIRTASRELRAVVERASVDITGLYDSAIRDFEIAALINSKLEAEEEEAIIRLLM